MKRNTQKAVAYYRTSSATNVGQDKDSEKRQKVACYDYAKLTCFDIIHEFYDADVQGTQDHLERPGFSEMVDYCQENDIKNILCENADRFSRDLMVQENGYREMMKAELTVIPVKNPELFLSDSDNPTRTMIRQVLGAVSQFEKSNLVLKLKGARHRKRAANKEKGIITLSGTGKCEGRKSYKETNSGLIVLAKKLYRKPRKGDRLSLRKVAELLAQEGYRTAKGNVFSASQVKTLVG
jgi:DNA invertase Pin-like site-specific DNA recombinase